MKVAWLALVLAVPVLSGCLDVFEPEPERGPNDPADVGYDPAEVTVTGVQVDELTIASDEVELDSLVYVPLTTDAPNGEPVQWPVVVLLHGWGFPKEMYTNAPLASSDPSTSLPNTNLMQSFAEGGLLTVAYDARGWYQSTGTSTVAGQAEMRDLRNVIDYVNENYETSGRVGLAGLSYGGAQSLLGWRDFDDVVTAAAHAPWVDLHETLYPGNVPLEAWGAFFAAVTPPGTTGTGTPQMMGEWEATMVARNDPEAVAQVEAQMDARSLMDDAADVNKPLFMCHGLQDTLMKQSHDVWMHTTGLTRVQYFQGGHNILDSDCWEVKTKQWFQHFLGGHDMDVASWPAVTTTDHSGDGSVTEYSEDRIREVEERTFFLHTEQLVESASPNRTFTIAQQLLSNPLSPPQGAFDSTTEPFPAQPAGMFQDPTAVFFTSAPVGLSETLLGAPEIHLQLQEEVLPFQVTATLFHESGSNWRPLGKTATSPLTAEHLDGLNVTLRMPWMKADLAPGERLVLKLGANDHTAYAPLPANFSAVFTGESTIDLPFFAPSGSAQ